MKSCLLVPAALLALGLALPAEGVPAAAAKTARPARNAEFYRATLARLVGNRSRSLAAAADIAPDGTTPPEPRPSAPLVVDGPPTVECPDAQFASIQAAVASAPPGGTIEVCPGLYTETVTVQKPLRLTARRDWPSAARCPNDPAIDPTHYAIVDSPGSGDAFRLRADRIALDGFVVQGNLRGIVTDPGFSGYAIANVILQNDTIGLSFASSGAEDSRIQRSCLRATNIGLDSFSLRSARVDHNELRENAFGVALVNSADVSVTRNEVSGSSQAGIFASLGADVSVRGNRVTRSESAIVYDSSDGDIRFNRIEQAADTAISLSSSQDVEVGFNYLRESGVGIQLVEADGNSVQHNLIEGSIRDGILLDTSDGNLIDRNLSRTNGADGVHVTSQSNANTIRQNQVRRNARFDCHDETVGAGTAGTANFWIYNHGDSAAPRGLCRAPRRLW